ncbi:MAG: ABC transporter permease/substrate-binding protein [Oscillospiraceae bacterium]|nr:ABC transporter permease/substrate-binding protein [Oscillospiraceae bacterium]MBQ9958983.1 ABC transporter permease/substrate-binding protein [Oscillospiraceae bacterium]
MMSFFEYCADNAALLLQLTVQHLRIGMLAVSCAILIGIPLGLLVARVAPVRKPILGAASVMQAIPSLALMGFFIPLVGIGDKTAIIIIALYAILPILRNTYTGLVNTDPNILEAARGIGMTEKQVLFKVQFPLALPVIMAGVRVAAVNSVSTATLAAFIGGGGLGKQIQAGIQIISTNMILSGAIPACILALTMDHVFGIIEKAVVPLSLSMPASAIDAASIAQAKRSRKRILTAVVLILAVLFGSIIYDSIDFDKTPTITIATTEYIELRIVSQIYAQLIEDRTDIKVVQNNAMGSFSVIWEALKAGEVDCIPGYTGTYYATVLGLPILPDMDADVMYGDIEVALEDFNVTGAGQLGPNNQYVFAVPHEMAEKYGLEKVSDLAPISEDLTVGCSANFYSRTPDGLFPVSEAYGLNFKNALTFGSAPMYLALENGDVDVIVTYRTDGLLQKYDLVFLEDDLQFFPPYVLFCMLGERAMAEYPELYDICMLLEKAITDEEMQDMNFRGAELGEEPADIAREFLISKGLISE